MKYLLRFSPLRAIRDLRVFLSYRRPYELWFLLLSVAITAVMMTTFMMDTRFDRPIKREIVYFDSWALDRTDKAIIDKQKIDQIAREKTEAEYQARVAKRRAEFKKIDDAMTAWGL